jgi:hypothetical protein
MVKAIQQGAPEPQTRATYLPGSCCQSPNAPHIANLFAFYHAMHLTRSQVSRYKHIFRLSNIRLIWSHYACRMARKVWQPGQHAGAQPAATIGYARVTRLGKRMPQKPHSSRGGHSRSTADRVCSRRSSRGALIWPADHFLQAVRCRTGQRSYPASIARQSNNQPGG